MCAAKPPKAKKVVTPPPQYLVNPLTDNLTTRGFLQSRAGRSSLVVGRGASNAAAAMPGATTVLPEASRAGPMNETEWREWRGKYGSDNRDLGKKYRTYLRDYDAGKFDGQVSATPSLQPKGKKGKAGVLARLMIGA
jgi:hypothetical protein